LEENETGLMSSAVFPEVYDFRDKWENAPESHLLSFDIIPCFITSLMPPFRTVSESAFGHVFHRDRAVRQEWNVISFRLNFPQMWGGGLLRIRQVVGSNVGRDTGAKKFRVTTSLWGCLRGRRFGLNCRLLWSSGGYVGGAPIPYFLETFLLRCLLPCGTAFSSCKVTV
jgi:hypothetical protein